MAREHRDRYASMDDVLADLERTQNGQPLREPWEVRRTKFQPGTHRRWLLVGACICLATVMAGLRMKMKPGLPCLVVAQTYSIPGKSTMADAVLADWDRDGRPDLVTMHDGRLKIVLHTGQLLHDRKPLSAQVTAQSSVLQVADVDNDGFLDAMVGYSVESNACLMAVNRAGWPIRTFSAVGRISEKTNVERQLPHFDPGQIRDLDGGGTKELILPLISTWQRDRGICCFDLNTGQQKWFYETAPFPLYFSFLDLDQDGKLEILAGANSPSNNVSLPDGTDDRHCYLYALSHDGNLLWQREVADFHADVRALPGFHPAIQSNAIVAWVRSIHHYHLPPEPPETGQVLAFDPAGNVITNYDAGLELLSCLAMDLDQDGREEFICTDREGSVHVLNADLSLRFRRSVVDPKFDRVELILAGSLPTRSPAPPLLVLYSSQVKFETDPNPGNDRSKASLAPYYDNCVIILDSQMNVVARHIVAEKWSEYPGFRVELITNIAEGVTEIWALGDKIQRLRLE